ncbi:hypothetical protein T310_7727 [Rasamsonia emersonii CBS 393.64]|uniref:Uncharacterized protein n=1 Tax=Rasamsonia emersonii (strain ATCC 16479 / CBS 393.64 / IMI 116815) TaxID=1408163 RepID=A0A0F4YJC6_RASE3|nr:hypothetical protein T310_7727 [Rasamsonia emersonii CBS 393.64]KKA18324.1 hypothetical protein T310_7727 [Rasamsonia emersonii CBS 393.64]
MNPRSLYSVLIGWKSLLSVPQGLRAIYALGMYFLLLQLICTPYGGSAISAVQQHTYGVSPKQICMQRSNIPAITSTSGRLWGRSGGPSRGLKNLPTPEVRLQYYLGPITPVS